MAKIKSADEITPAGQEEIQNLTPESAITDDGILVRPKEDVLIVGTENSILGEGVEHTVHRLLAEKLINKGQAKKA